MVRAKMLGKKIVAKIFDKKFLYTLDYRVQKMVGKNARNNFPETHEWFEQKCWEKKLSPKSAKNVFLHSHEYRN